MAFNPTNSFFFLSRDTAEDHVFALIHPLPHPISK